MSDREAHAGRAEDRDPVELASLPYTIGSKTLPGLAKTIEEGGERLTIVGKIMAVGSLDAPYWGGVNLRERLAEEMGDQMAAFDYFIDHVDPAFYLAVEMRRQAKRATFDRWHAEANPPPPKVYACTVCNDGERSKWDLPMGPTSALDSDNGKAGHCPSCGVALYDEIPF